MTHVSVVVSLGLPTRILSTFLMFTVHSASHIDCTSAFQFISSEVSFVTKLEGAVAGKQCVAQFIALNVVDIIMQLLNRRKPWKPGGFCVFSFWIRAQCVCVCARDFFHFAERETWHLTYLLGVSCVDVTPRYVWRYRHHRIGIMKLCMIIGLRKCYVFYCESFLLECKTLI